MKLKSQILKKGDEQLHKCYSKCQSIVQLTYTIETITSQTCTLIQQNRHLITNQQTEKTAEPTTMAFKLHPNQGTFILRYD